MARGQAERLFGLLEELLAAAGAQWRDLCRIGVGIGPGNFTGTRISVAAARGLALSLGIPAIGVSSLEALAIGLDGPVLCSVDARADQVYLQLFNNGRAEAPFQAGLDAIPSQVLPRGGIVIGHEADAIAQRLGAVTGTQPVARAPAIAMIASSRSVDPALRPAPLYLRPADAAPARDLAPRLLP